MLTTGSEPPGRFRGNLPLAWQGATNALRGHRARHTEQPRQVLRSSAKCGSFAGHKAEWEPVAPARSAAGADPNLTVRIRS